MRSSSSSRSFSACSRRRSRTLSAITLKDSARSPSWSRLVTRMGCRKSPWRSRSVPCESSWMLRVIERARTRPSSRATPYMTRKTPATAASAFTSRSAMLSVLGESRRPSWWGSNRKVRGSSSSSPSVQRRLSGVAKKVMPPPPADSWRAAALLVLVVDVDAQALAAVVRRPSPPAPRNWTPIRWLQVLEQPGVQGHRHHQEVGALHGAPPAVLPLALLDQPREAGRP